MVAVSELVFGLDAELVRLGYKASTMAWYRGCWRRLQRFFASRGVQEFSLDLAMAWVDQACGGFFDKEQAGTLKPTDVYLFRVAQMLDDFAVHGAVLRRYSRTVGRLTAGETDMLARFQAWLESADCAASTVRAYATVAGEFIAFAGARGGLDGLDAGVIDAFVATLAGYQAKTMEHKLCAVRSFLRFAGSSGLVDEAVLEAVPAAKSARQVRIPSVWNPGRCNQGPGGDRPGQPVRQAGLRDHFADHQARAARHRCQAVAVRRFRLAWQPVVGGAGQDGPPGAAAAAERCRLGGDRLSSFRPPAK